MDEYYTPSHLAEVLVNIVGRKRSGIIADFAAGGGELLLQAQKRWPLSRVIATDISTDNVLALRRDFKDWIIGKCDFMDQISRSRCKALHGMEKKISLALLNPPFSCRGGTSWRVSIDKIEIHCSLAAGFVLNALSYLVPGGDLVAIVPLGSLNSEKDRIAWQMVRQLGRMKVKRINGGRTFKGSSAKTAIVHISMGQRTHQLKKTLGYAGRNSTARSNGIEVVLSRGTIPMSNFTNGIMKTALPLVHTTDLKSNRIIINGRRVSKYSRAISGPAVLLPRVGKPIKEKIVLYQGKDAIVLSDCVVALRTKSAREASIVKRALDNAWDSIEKRYTGTCARYITLSSIRGTLVSLGFGVVIENSGPETQENKDNRKRSIE